MEKLKQVSSINQFIVTQVKVLHNDHKTGGPNANKYRIVNTMWDNAGLCNIIHRNLPSDLGYAGLQANINVSTVTGEKSVQSREHTLSIMDELCNIHYIKSHEYGAEGHPGIVTEESKGISRRLRCKLASKFGVQTNQISNITGPIEMIIGIQHNELAPTKLKYLYSEECCLYKTSFGPKPYIIAGHTLPHATHVSAVPRAHHVAMIQSATSQSFSDDFSITFYCADGTVNCGTAYFIIHSKLIRSILLEVPPTMKKEFFISLPSAFKSHILHLKDILSKGKTKFSNSEFSNPTTLQNLAKEITDAAKLLGINILNQTLQYTECNHQAFIKTSTPKMIRKNPEQILREKSEVSYRQSWDQYKQSSANQRKPQMETKLINGRHQPLSLSKRAPFQQEMICDSSTQANSSPNSMSQATKFQDIFANKCVMSVANAKATKSEDPQEKLTSFDLLKHIFKIGAPHKNATFPAMHLTSSGIKVPSSPKQHQSAPNAQ